MALQLVAKTATVKTCWTMEPMHQNSIDRPVRSEFTWAVAIIDLVLAEGLEMSPELTISQKFYSRQGERKSQELFKSTIFLFASF